MVIFRALGCNLEGIICQPAIWAQGELSVTRKALVLRVASGELAKHRPILDFGGAIGIFLCMMSIFIHRHDMMMIYTVYIYICISNIILRLLCEISYVDGVLLWLVFFWVVSVYCISIYWYYIYIQILDCESGLWDDLAPWHSLTPRPATMLAPQVNHLFCLRFWLAPMTLQCLPQCSLVKKIRGFLLRIPLRVLEVLCKLLRIIHVLTCANSWWGLVLF